MQKISLFHWFILQIVNFRVPSHDWLHPFLTTPTPKIFNVLLTCMNLYQHAKNQLILEINLGVQRPDLLNLLWRNSSFRNYAIWLAESILAYISGTRFFPNRFCAGTQQIINIFIIEQIQWKLMTKFFFKFKKHIFGPFPQFLGQKKFFLKNQVVMHNFIRLSSTLAKSREI